MQPCVPVVTSSTDCDPVSDYYFGSVTYGRSFSSARTILKIETKQTGISGVMLYAVYVIYVNLHL